MTANTVVLPLRRLTPVLPAPLLIIIAAILAVKGLQLDAEGVAVIGRVPLGVFTVAVALGG